MPVIVVTGGAGFVGSHVAEHFASKGHFVRVIDNESRAQLLGQPGVLSNSRWLSGLDNVEVSSVSVLDADALPRLLQGAELVVHAAAQTAVTTSVEDPITDFEVNARGTLNVLEAIRRAAADAVFLFCSTNKVYGENVNTLPIEKGPRSYRFSDGSSGGVSESLSIDRCAHSPYGASKLAADLYVQEYAHLYGLKATVFRMSCIYGPRQWGVVDQGWVAWFTRALLTGMPITIYGDGYQSRDVLFVSDLIAAFELAAGLGQHGEVFNIGGGPELAVSLLDVLELLQEITGRDAQLRFEDWRPSDQKVYVTDITKARNLLDWAPLVDVRTGLERLVTWTSENQTATGERASAQ